MDKEGKATHDFDGERYAKASAHQDEWGRKLIAELELTGAERILDLGCGDGHLTALLAARVPVGSVLGIDASPGMLNAARKHEAPNLRFGLMDINAMDFREEFDVIFSNATLQWIKDHARLMRSVLCALRNGGYLRFQFAGDGTCSHFNKVVREAMAHADFRGYFTGFDWPWFKPGVEEYMALMTQTPFKEQRVWGENADRHFLDAETMLRWVDVPVIVPFLARVAEKDKPAFRNFVVERMIEETQQPDGRCFETFRRINVFARKVL